MSWLHKIAKRSFSTEEARSIGDRIGIDWDAVDLEQFRMGLEVEMEHGSHDKETDVILLPEYRLHLQQHRQTSDDGFVD